MISALDRCAQELGDGRVLPLDAGEIVFKLDSYKNNPIVKPQDLGLTWYEHHVSQIGAVFNGGAELFKGKVVMTPRCHRSYRMVRSSREKLAIEEYYVENYISEIWLLSSEDGVHFFRFGDAVIKGNGTDHTDFIYGIEDMRIIKYEHMYLLIGCGKVKPPFRGGNGDRIAVYSTSDFVDITYHGMVQGFDSRNAVPFSEHVDGKLYVLLRFHPNIYLGFLEAGIDQLLNPFKYRKYWQRVYEQRRQNLLLKAGDYPHEKEKIGPGTQLIKTDRGWLLVYHAVGEINDILCRAYALPGKIKKGYSICAALLDIDEPRKVLCRTRNPIYIPSFPYELEGNEQYLVDVPNVVFPVGAIVWKDKLLLYAGSGDKYMILLSCKLNDLVNYLWHHCKHV